MRRIKRQACPWALLKLRREAPNAQFVFLSKRGACGPYRQNIVSVLQSGHNVCSFAQYVEKLWRSCWTACAGRETISNREAPMRGG
jgi:hypothetical protein